jgi:hypothetical protein
MLEEKKLRAIKWNGYEWHIPRRSGVKCGTDTPQQQFNYTKYGEQHAPILHVTTS